ncbi:MAG: alpha/beta hydrolase [Myxococcota bacterium]
MLSLRDLRIIERTSTFALRAWGFQSRWIETTEGRLHALVRGGSRPTPPIVLLHGLVASAADYFPLLQRLAGRGYTLVAPDLPGHGLSPVPARGMRADVLSGALTEALDQVLDQPAVVFGNSMGGFAAVRLATTRPDLVGGLFLASPGGAPLTEPELSKFLARFRIRDPATARRFLHDTQARPSFVPSFVAWTVVERFSRPEIRELLAGMHSSDLLTAEELGSLRQPTVVMWGRKERILTPLQREFFRTNLPDHAVFEEPPGLGHAPFMDDPSYVVGRFLKFVDTCTPLEQGSHSLTAAPA